MIFSEIKTQIEYRIDNVLFLSKIFIKKASLSKIKVHVIMFSKNIVPGTVVTWSTRLFNDKIV